MHLSKLLQQLQNMVKTHFIEYVKNQFSKASKCVVHFDRLCLLTLFFGGKRTERWVVHIHKLHLLAVFLLVKAYWKSSFPKDV